MPSPCRKRLAEMIRVDHAGEYAAVAIYRGQRAIFERRAGSTRIAGQIKHMETEEQAHLDAFDALIAEYGVRPTLMSPLWNMAGFGLGVVTALAGEKTAHLCTEAVESVIETHYDQQVSELEHMDVPQDLTAQFAQFRDDEAQHRQLAQDEGAQEAPLHAPVSALIRAGCRAAIAISQKI